MSSSFQTPSARLAVLDAVRRGRATIVALSGDLGVTDNAVRLHLTALERDGLVARSLIRSGRPGQPAAEYVLTETGDEALSLAYPPAFAALIAALGERLDARTLRAVLVDAGERLAKREGEAATSLSARAERCAELLRSLGGAVELETRRGEATLVGAGCPLASAVRRVPATCTLIESLLEHACGVEAEQQCRHGDRPRCRFRLTA